MKHIKAPTFFILLLLIVLILPRGIVSAGSNGQNSVPTPTVTATPGIPTPFVSSGIPGLLNADAPTQISELTDLLTFEDFGFDEVTLHGPFATNDYYFDLPFTWQVKPGVTLRLVMDT